MRGALDLSSHATADGSPSSAPSTCRSGTPRPVIEIALYTNVMLLQNLPGSSKVGPGDPVITAGSRSSRLESLFPKGIVIGKVTNVSTDALTGASHQVTLKPAADLRHLDFVQVLTRPQAGLRAELNQGGNGP